MMAYREPAQDRAKDGLGRFVGSGAYPNPDPRQPFAQQEQFRPDRDPVGKPSRAESIMLSGGERSDIRPRCRSTMLPWTGSSPYAYCGAASRSPPEIAELARVIVTHHQPARA